ncbi:MAG: GFA family protein [Hyphomonadaceae bacterium]
MSETFEGGCACGAVRYRMQSRPMITHCCHCLDCQRQTGSAFAINALIEADRVAVLQGGVAPSAMPTDSGTPHAIFRCTECGTALWSEYGGRAEVRFVRVGTLDEPHAIAPDIHIYTRSKVPWVRLPEGALAVDAYYRAKDVWPAESLARRNAAYS